MLDPRLFTLLCCPCGGDLDERGDALHCRACELSHPVVGGIARFARSADEGQAQVSSAFGYKWTRGSAFAMSGQTQAIMDDWLLDLRGWRNETEFGEFLTPFKTILDAGVGNGRDVVQLAKLKPEALIVGIDVSEAIDVAAEHAKGLSNVLLVQGDISRPPFRQRSFDYVTSLGVLHHTPSTEAAVRALYPLLKEGGEFAFTIYRKKAPVREFTDDHIRQQIRAMSPAEAWKEMESVTLFGKALSDLNIEIDVPEVRVLGIEGGIHNLQRLIYYTMLKCYWRDAFSFDDNAHVNYDWFYPQYAWRHTPEEARGWIASLGAREVFFKEIPAQLSFRLQRA